MKTLILHVIWFVSSMTWAASGITYHGRILRSDNTPVVSPTTEFRIQIKSPGDEGCLMWEEFQTKDLSQTAGVFSITIGDIDATNRTQVNINNPLTSSPFTLLQVFSNKNSFPSGLTCDDASGTYTPATNHGRTLQVYFRETNVVAWEEMPPASINYVPLAYNSTQLDGYRSNEFLKIDPLAVYTPLTAGQVNTLVDIIAGTNTQYLRPATTFGGDVSGTYNAISVNRIRGTNVVATVPTLNQVLKFDGTNWVPSADDTGGAPGDASYAAKGIVQINTDETTSGLYIASGVLALPNVITAGGPIGSTTTVPVITYDQKGRLTTVTTATIDDATKLPLLGGTMTGPINMGTQNITNATSIAATNFSGRNLILNDNDTNTATIRAPADITVDYNLTLPTGAPTNGYVLSTDAAGQLSWIAAASGDITEIVAGNGLTGDAPSGVATLAVGAGAGIVANANDVAVDVGLGANKIPQVGGVALGANGVIVANGTGTALTSMNCTVNQVIKFDASGFATCGTDEVGTGAFVNNGNSFGGLATLGTNDNHALAFETNSTTKMTLTAGGFLGVNTTTPQSFIDIAVPISDTTSLPHLILSSHDQTYADPALLLIHTRPNLTSGWGSAGVGGWKIGSTSGSGGSGGMAADFNLCSRNGAAGENCRLHIDYATGKMNLGGANASLHMASKVNVQGNMTVGTSWSSYNTEQAAPVNSLIVEGMIGAGIAAPATALDVNGAISARGMAAPALAPAGQGRIYFDSTSNTFRVSQNGGAYQEVTVGGFMNGGNSYGANANLGTNDNFALNFETNNIQRMTILNNGNIGFGTSTNPTGLFEVSASTLADGSTGKSITLNAQSSNETGGNITLQSGYRDTRPGGQLVLGGSGWIPANTTLSAADGDVNGSPGNLVLKAGHTANTGGGYVNILGGATTNGTSGSIFLSSGTATSANYGNIILGMDNLGVARGRVGIAINSPSSILDINGAVTQRGMAVPAVSPAGQGRIYFDSTSNKFRVSQNGGGYTDLVPTVNGDILQDGNSFGSAMTIGSNDSFALNMETNGSSRMTILNSGFVGVGNSSPAELFAVGINSQFRVSNAGAVTSNSGYGTSGITLNSGTAGYGLLQFASPNGDAGRIRFASGQAGYAWDTAIYRSVAGELTIDNNVGGAAGLNVTGTTSLASISGGVGIGTATPRAKLDVNGTIVTKAATSNATGTIDFTSGNLQFTNSNCGAYAFHNLKDGGAYTFAVKGTAIATCSFTAFSDAGVTTLTVKMPPDHGPTTNTKHTLYNLLVMGTDVYVAWTPGY